MVGGQPGVLRLVAMVKEQSTVPDPEHALIQLQALEDWIVRAQALKLFRLVMVKLYCYIIDFSDQCHLKFQDGLFGILGQAVPRPVTMAIRKEPEFA